MSKTIKVQLKGVLSGGAIIASGAPTNDQLLTFHAYTDSMKARILDYMVLNPGQVIVTQTNEEPRNGEWFE